MGFFSPALTSKHQALFFHQLAWSAQSGMPVLRALEIIAAEVSSREVKRLSVRLADNLRHGATFSQAADREASRFPAFVTAMMNVGERAGRLTEVFQWLDVYFEQRVAFQRAVFQQILYPILVVLTALVGIPLLRSFLTAPDVWTMTRDMALILVSFCGTVFFWCAVIAVVNRILPVRRFGLRVFSHLWPLSRIIPRLAMHRFAWAMQISAGMGGDVEEALRLSARTADLPAVEKKLLRACPPLKTGATLSEAIAKCSCFTPQHKAYIAAGEASGKLPDSFQYIARDQIEEAIQALRLCIIALGPLLIILLGLWILAALV